MQDQGRNKSTLNYFKVLIFSSFLASANIYLPFTPSKIFGFGLTGYSWILVLIVSIYYLISKNSNSKFKATIWLPWMIFSIIYLIRNTNAVSLQGTVQSFVPILVGLVAGSLNYNLLDLKKILKYFMYLIIIIILSNTLLSYVRLGMVGYGSATDAHLTAIAVIVVFALYYSQKQFKYLIYYVLILIVPVVAVTRMGIFVLLVIPLIHFYQILNFKKILIILILIPISIYIFQLPAIQEKMFYTDSGTIQDLSYDNENLNTSGRKYVNDLMIEEVKKDPIWGKGARADYSILKKNGLGINETHNDYLQLLINFGILGTSILFLTFILQCINITSIKINTLEQKIIRSIILTMQITLFFFMLSDTIIRGTFDFMNYYFALIGMFYALNYQTRKNIRRNEQITLSETKN